MAIWITLVDEEWAKQVQGVGRGQVKHVGFELGRVRRLVGEAVVNGRRVD